MTTMELIKQLRDKTAAGMADCKSALEESGWDYEKALDLIKVRNLAIADSRSTKVAAEGVVVVRHAGNDAAMLLEINCSTDFCARSPEFIEFANEAVRELMFEFQAGRGHDYAPSPSLEEARKTLVGKTRENIVIRRWWGLQAGTPNTRVFSYIHSNSKLGVLLTMTAENEEQANSPEFKELSENVAMQICALPPLAASSDKLSDEQINRQRAIFAEQVKDKPAASQEKIILGKLNKWFSEVALIEQECVWTPKKKVKDMLGKATVEQFFRCAVGEDVVVEKSDLAKDVEEMTGVRQDHWGIRPPQDFADVVKGVE